MKKIELRLSEDLITEKDRKYLSNIFKKIKNNISVEEGGVGEAGGIAWFPTDLIIMAFGLTAAGFFAALGDDLYKKLKKKLISILKEEKRTARKISHFYIAFENKNMALYFEVFEFFSENLDHAVDKIEIDYPILLREALKIKKADYYSVGKFESITYNFNEDEDRWIISHFNTYKG